LRPPPTSTLFPYTTLFRSFVWEAWAIGGIFALFLLGTVSTKDFSDMAGDRAHGCVTLPIRFGVARAARLIAPFFVVPWLLIPLLDRKSTRLNSSHLVISYA